MAGKSRHKKEKNKFPVVISGDKNLKEQIKTTVSTDRHSETTPGLSIDTQ